MQFLSGAECEPFFAKLGFDRDGLIAGSRGADRFKTLEVFYDPKRHAEQIGKSVAASQGGFAQCLVWCYDLVFGDRSLEPHAPLAWRQYASWRAAHGEPRALHEAPGHLFAPDERDLLGEVVAFAVRLGWEAYIAAKPNKFVVGISHDDYLTIYSRSTPSGLLDDLRALGLEPKRARPRPR